ncbi:MAG: hypothetical protein MZV64_26380 [Ignavibacteriales bacterium]|nr:hypothetical protein [Ignavibacteriales bacterium]
MLEENRTFARWYDEDIIVSNCVKKLESVDDTLKRKTASFLMDQIISQPPFCDMLSR